MVVLLPQHDGLAAYVAQVVPEARVLSYDGRTSAAYAEVTFYCVPYARDDKSRALISQLPALQAVQSLSSGVDDLLSLVPPALTLCNGRGLHHEEGTAELAVLLILSMLRGMPSFVKAQEQRTWHHVRGASLQDRRILLVGYGSIGKMVESHLLAFGAIVEKVSRTARTGVHGYDALSRQAEDADVLVICVPLTAATRGIVDARVLAALPDGAIVVNVGRGPAIDAAALRAELISGRLSAALDVTDPEPLPHEAPEWSMPNVLITPHVGGDTNTFVSRARDFLADQVRRHLSGASLQNVVSR